MTLAITTPRQNTSKQKDQPKSDEDGYRVEELTLSSGSHVTVKPLILSGGQWLLTLSNGAVHVFNIRSGRRVHVLQSEDEGRDGEDPVISMTHDPSSDRRIITCSRSCVFRVWDVQLAVVIHKYSELTMTGKHMENFHYVTRSGDLFFMASRAAENSADCADNKPSAAHLWRMKWPPVSAQQHHRKSHSQPQCTPLKYVQRRRQHGTSSNTDWSVVFACGDRVFAAITDRRHHSITVCAIFAHNDSSAVDGDKTFQRHKHVLRGDIKRPFTCLSGHPSEPCVAAGDSSGRVLLWRDLLLVAAGDHTPPCTVLHWHTLPVNTVAFSPVDGCRLYSGGAECVLVTWQLQRDGVERRFLPRLGMPIEHLSCDQSSVGDEDGRSALVAVAHCDNVIRLVDSENGYVLQLLRSLVISDLWRTLPTPPLSVCREPHALVLNAAVGQLQFLSSDCCAELFSLDITSTNYVSRERRQQHSARQCDVSHVVFTGHSRWMVTMETACSTSPANQTPDCDDVIDDVRCDDRLKFWRFDSALQQFVLNTCVDEPHDGVTACLEASTAPLAATCATDGLVKLWQCVELAPVVGRHSESDGGGESWSCCAILQHRQLPSSLVSLSPDGASVAALFGGSSVVVWSVQPQTSVGYRCTQLLSQRLAVLNIHGHDEHARITRLHLVAPSSPSSHDDMLVVVGSGEDVFIWRVLSQTLCARLNIANCCVIVHPLTGVMAIFSAPSSSSSDSSHDVCLSVWNVRSVELMCEQLLPVGRVLAACFDSNDAEATNCHRIFCLSDQASLHSLTVLPSGTAGCNIIKMLDSGDVSTLKSAVDIDNCLNDRVTPFSALLAQKRRVDVSRGAVLSVTSSDDSVDAIGVEILSSLDNACHTLNNLPQLCETFTEHILPLATPFSCDDQDDDGCTDFQQQRQQSEEHSQDIPASSDLVESLSKLAHTDFSFVVS